MNLYWETMASEGQLCCQAIKTSGRFGEKSETPPRPSDWLIHPGRRRKKFNGAVCWLEGFSECFSGAKKTLVVWARVTRQWPIYFSNEYMCHKTRTSKEWRALEKRNEIRQLSINNVPPFKSHGETGVRRCWIWMGFRYTRDSVHLDFWLERETQLHFDNQHFPRLNT